MFIRKINLKNIAYFWDVNIYLLINYNTIRNYILITYELSNFDHVLGIVSQTRFSGANRNHDPHADSLAHYPLDYQGTLRWD